MKASVWSGTLLALLVSPVAPGDERSSTVLLPRRPELRRDLLDRMERDQAPRRELMQRMRVERVSDPEDLDPMRDDLLTTIREVDAGNRAWLKRVIAEHGWPGRSLVGADGAHAAWLLVQHADADRTFQRECLRLMEAAGADEVAGEDVAYLIDRVRLAEGRRQLYGTQLEFRGGAWVPRAVEDEPHVDQRRKERGLPPLAEYLESVREMLRGPNK